MQCPHCHSENLKVIDSRDTEDSIRRRRECEDCKERFTTYERTESSPLFVLKKDGRREPFDRNKLMRGITIACGKRPISQEKIEHMVSEIETQLREQGKSEVKSRAVGDLVMEKLKALDYVAYIRFASVYKPNQFRDIEDIEKELKALKKGG
jgi:transcriptional repressor NrdR